MMSADGKIKLIPGLVSMAAATAMTVGVAALMTPWWWTSTQMSVQRRRRRGADAGTLCRVGGWRGVVVASGGRLGLATARRFCVAGAAERGARRWGDPLRATLTSAIPRVSTRLFLVLVVGTGLALMAGAWPFLRYNRVSVRDTARERALL